MRDLGSQHFHAFAHESGQTRPAFGRDHGAVDIGLVRLDVDIGAARQNDFRLTSAQGRHFLATNDPVYRDEDLNAVAYREDGLFLFVEMTDHGLNALVGPDVLRPAPAGAIYRVVFVQVHLGEGLVDFGQMPEALDIGLVSLEVMQRCLDHLARLFIRANDMDGMAYGLHALLENKDLIFLGEFTAKHEDFLAVHIVLLWAVRAARLGGPACLHQNGLSGK